MKYGSVKEVPPAAEVMSQAIDERDGEALPLHLVVDADVVRLQETHALLQALGVSSGSLGFLP